MICGWKDNWKESREHFMAWWEGEGCVISFRDAPPAKQPHEPVPPPGEVASIEQARTDPVWRAEFNHYKLSRQSFPADNLPWANTSIGPGSLALLLGAEPGFAKETVWFKPSIHNEERPEDLPPFRFDSGKAHV